MDDWQTEYTKRNNETDTMLLLSPYTAGGKWNWTLIDLDADGSEITSSAHIFDTPELAADAAIDYFNNKWLPRFQATGDREGQ